MHTPSDNTLKPIEDDDDEAFDQKPADPAALNAVVACSSSDPAILDTAQQICTRFRKHHDRWTYLTTTPDGIVIWQYHTGKDNKVMQTMPLIPSYFTPERKQALRQKIKGERNAEH